MLISRSKSRKGEGGRGGAHRAGRRGEVEAELLAEPVDGAAASLGENLGRGRARARARGVRASAGPESRGNLAREREKYRGGDGSRARAGGSHLGGERCARGVVCPTPAAPLMMSASGYRRSLDALGGLRARERAVDAGGGFRGLLPPRRQCSKSTRPPCSSTVCAAERPARPPPMTMICSLILMRAWKPAGRSGA